MSNPRRTDEEITAGLMMLIACSGNAKAAKKLLEEQGTMEIVPAHETLQAWKTRYADRYEDLRMRYREQLEQQIIGESYEIIQTAQELEREAMQAAIKNVKKGKDRDPGRTAANAAMVAEKTTRSALTLQARPTSIREDRNLEEILRKLYASGVVTLPEEERAMLEASVEEPEPEPEEGPEENAGDDQ